MLRITLTRDYIIFFFFKFSAAHCIQNKGRIDKLSTSNVSAIFGAHNLTDSYEAGKFSLTPESIQIHEDWNKDEDGSFDADIAIMTFEKNKILRTHYIRPICLWNEEGEKKIPSGNGIVSGWGQSRHTPKKFEPVSTKLEVPIRTNEFCFSTNDELRDLSSHRTICAGAGDGSGICFGDSGGSLVVQVNSTFYFRGIISSTLTNEVGSCDVSTYQIYTDALKYFRWMKYKMKQVVYEISTDGDWRGKNFTTCYVDGGQYIDEEGFTIDSTLEGNSIVKEMYVEFFLNINFLPEDVAEKFPNLVEYHAKYGTLKLINERNFANLTKLKRINLMENRIESIASDAFKDLSELKQLSLSYNRIKVIDPKWFQSLTNLEFLSLYENEIKLIASDAFKDLRELEQLNLSTNKIKVVDPQWFQSLTKLKVLGLGNNTIKVVDSKNFNNLLKLTTLQLYDNKIASIASDAFKDLNELKTLCLRGNNINVVDPTWFLSLTKLEELNLGNNDIESIASDAFKDLSELEILDLYDNKIKVVDSKWFQYLSKLKYLTLYKNEIENLDENTFENLMNLTKLDLSFNKLTSISGKLFENNLKLGEINLRYNQIKVINSGLFDLLPKLYIVDLGNNKCVDLKYYRSDVISIKKQLNDGCQDR